jgi:ribosomal protein S18 acetylase RimI-like enzyme
VTTDESIVDPTVRLMTASDVAIVTALHVESWRRAYRGLLTDDYLAHRVEGERRSCWERRLASASAEEFGHVASRESVAVGFSFVSAADETGPGCRLDNLHVLPSAQGSGLGRSLMAAAAREIIGRCWDPRLFLWVFEANIKARDFYVRQGGSPTELREIATPDGGVSRAWRYEWKDLRVLCAPLG